MMTSHQRVLGDLLEAAPAPEQLAARDAQARAAVAARRRPGRRRTAPRSSRAASARARARSRRSPAAENARGSRRAARAREIARASRASVASPAAAFSTARSGPLTASNGAHLNVLKPCASSFADDRGVFLGAARSQRAVDRRVERQPFERRAVAEQLPHGHLLAFGEQVVERLVQARERRRRHEVGRERGDLALLAREALERQREAAVVSLEQLRGRLSAALVVVAVRRLAETGEHAVADLEDRASRL